MLTRIALCSLAAFCLSAGGGLAQKIINKDYQNITPKWVEERFDQIDTDDDGTITMQEWQERKERWKNPPLFTAMNTDENTEGTPKISRAEWIYFFDERMPKRYELR